MKSANQKIPLKTRMEQNKGLMPQRLGVTSMQLMLKVKHAIIIKDRNKIMMKRLGCDKNVHECDKTECFYFNGNQLIITVELVKCIFK